MQTSVGYRVDGVRSWRAGVLGWMGVEAVFCGGVGSVCGMACSILERGEGTAFIVHLLTWRGSLERCSSSSVGLGGEGEGAGARGVSQWWRCVVAGCGGRVSAMWRYVVGALTVVGAFGWWW